MFLLYRYFNLYQRNYHFPKENQYIVKQKKQKLFMILLGSRECIMTI